MIYLTGDCHGDFTRFFYHNFPEQELMTKDDIVIILGDFGGVWQDTRKENWWLGWLDNKPFTTCFIDGNHENFNKLKEFETVEYHGGMAHKIRDNIYHLMRGYIFEFENKKFFCMGGASSYDVRDGILYSEDFNSYDELLREYKKMTRQGKMVRINNVSWWQEELPSDEEFNCGKQNLEKQNYKVDYVISHCLPHSVELILSNGLYESNELTLYFDKLINKGLKFDSWYCGHYHVNQIINDKFNILYNKIVKIKEN